MAREAFGNRFTFIAAGIGMAVGAGNIWRFPRVAAEFGGGTFLVVLLLANLVWAIPLLAAETLIGRKSQLGTVGAIRDLMGRKYTWIGAWVGVVTLGILFYYTVIAGWGFRYLAYSVTGTVGKGGGFSSALGRVHKQPVTDDTFRGHRRRFHGGNSLSGPEGRHREGLADNSPCPVHRPDNPCDPGPNPAGRGGWSFIPLRPRMEPAW